MNNPTYGEVFLEIDNLILYFADDFHHIFLESIEIGEEIEENVYKIEFFLQVESSIQAFYLILP